MLPRSTFVVLGAVLLAPAVVLAAKPPPPNEIVVSAANYAQTPPKVLEQMFRKPADLTDAPPPAATERPVQHYQFLKGEVYEADLNYEEVCKLLVPALAGKNLRNTFDQSKVDLILRVSFGGRRWRDPFVREGDLEWKHGLVPRKRGTSLSAASAWDDRAGGDEAALRQTEEALGSAAEGMADRLINGMSTEDYFLIVVDAFEVAALKTKGNSTPRAWTTFIAVRQRDRAKFSAVASEMIAKAAPFFGETLPGKARFIDRQGTVTPGELRVVEENVPAPPPSK
ncbi:MAG TPA: hypothetical protein VK477_07280 [Acidobacteriota bacterium]|nr:hypothetical protein [Acidobacteriota bacterium]